MVTGVSSSLVEFSKYAVDDLIKIESIDNDNSDDGYFFEIIEKHVYDDDDINVMFVGHLEGLLYKLEISSKNETASLKLDNQTTTTENSLCPIELLEFCPDFKVLHDDLVKRNKYPILNTSRHKPIIHVNYQKHEKVTDCKTIVEKALKNPSFWADGTTPTQKALTIIERNTLNAGEIYALLAGNRPLALIQLYAPFVENGQIQPIDMPFVKRALREVAKQNLIFACIPSKIEGSSETFSAIIYPKISPNKERAELLSSFGAQGALVAQSAYYGVLIGECLGYKKQNIYHHVKKTCNLRGEISNEVLEQVIADLYSASPVPSLLRWRDGYEDNIALQISANEQTRKKKKKVKSSSSSPSSIEEVERLFLSKKKR